MIYLPHRRKAFQAAGGGPNQYYYAAETANGTVGIVGEYYPTWDDIVVSTGGTLTELGVHLDSVDDGGDFKLALYDSSDNLVTGASGVVTVVNTGADNDAWASVTGLSVSISSGTYSLLIQLHDSVTLYVDTLGNSGYGQYWGGGSYSSAPVATLHTEDGNENKQLMMRVFVE